MSQKNLKKRDDSIDALRALGVILVVIYHFTLRFKPETLKFETAVYGFNYGIVGVYLFFVISGYCISMTAERSGNAYEFLVKRISRLVPAFTICVLITAFFLAVFDSHRVTNGFWNVVGNIFWLPLFTSSIKMVDGAYWSLFVEIKYYFIFALFFALTGCSKKTTIIFMFFSIIGFAIWYARLGILAPTLLYPYKGIPQTYFLFPFSFMFLHGMILRQYSSKFMHAASFILTSCIMYFALNKAGIFLWTMGLIGLATLFLPWRGLRIHKSITYVGLMSYTFYLIHENVGIAIIRELSQFGINSYIRILIAIIITFFIGVIVSKLVEHRFRKNIENVFLNFTLVPKAAPPE